MRQNEIDAIKKMFGINDAEDVKPSGFLAARGILRQEGDELPEPSEITIRRLRDSVDNDGMHPIRMTIKFAPQDDEFEAFIKSL